MFYNGHLKFQTSVSIRTPLYGSRNLAYIAHEIDYYVSVIACPGVSHVTWCNLFCQVKPLFDLAGVKCDVVVTERANHAQELLQTYDFERIDGVVSVGGDGMFREPIQ